MGYKLRRWLALILPPGISFSERLVALEITDQVNDDTRIGTAVDLEDVARRTGLANAKQVGAVLGKLAAHGVELRIPIGKRKDGKPTFSYPGRKTNYRVPTATELDLEEIPPTRDHSTPMVPSPRDLNGPVATGPLTENGPVTTDEWSRGDGRMVPSPRDPAPHRPSKNPHKEQRAARAKPRATDGDDTKDKTESDGQRINRLAKIYYDRVKLSSFQAVTGVVRIATGAGYTDEQITGGLNRLADRPDMALTTNTLRIEIESESAGPRRPASRNGHDGRHVSTDFSDWEIAS